MNPEVITAGDRGERSRVGEPSWARTVGWWFFLALVALTPLIIGALPPQLGPLSFYQAWDPVSLPKAVAFLSLSGLSLSAFCFDVLRGRSEVRWHPVLTILLALFAWAGVSTLFSPSIGLVVWGEYLRNEGLVAYGGYLLVAFLAVQYVRSTRSMRLVMIVAVASGCIVAAYALLQYAGVDPIQWANVERAAQSTFGNADMLGTYLLLPLGLSVGLALTAEGTWRALSWWAATVLVSAALWASATRGAWIGALVMVLCFGLFGLGPVWRLSRRRRILLGGVALVAVVGTTVGIVLARPIRAGSSTMLWSVLARASNGRTIIWATGLRALLTHPITGWAPGGFQRAFESAVGPDWYALLAGSYRVVDSAHNFLVETLVTLGVPGFLLVVVALAWTATASFSTLREVQGRFRLLFVSLWAILAGMTAGLALGATMAGVSVWLWLVVGLLVTTSSHVVSKTPRSAVILAAALGLLLAVWSGTWLAADVVVGHAMQSEAGPSRVSALESAVSLNPLSPRYRWMLADAIAANAVIEQRSGQSRQVVDATTNRAIAGYYAAAEADRGDLLPRIALVNFLLRYAVDHPGSDAANRAVDAALSANALAPRDALTLVTLAKAYAAAGQTSQARSTADLVRSIAPAFAAQALGPTGLTGVPRP